MICSKMKGVFTHKTIIKSLDSGNQKIILNLIKFLNLFGLENCLKTMIVFQNKLILFCLIKLHLKLKYLQNFNYKLKAFIIIQCYKVGAILIKFLVMLFDLFFLDFH